MSDHDARHVAGAGTAQRPSRARQRRPRRHHIVDHKHSRRYCGQRHDFKTQSAFASAAPGLRATASSQPIAMRDIEIARHRCRQNAARIEPTSGAMFAS